MEHPTNYKYHSTQQFRNVVKSIRDQATFGGFDKDGNAVKDVTKPIPRLEYIGTTKLHGTNASIVLHEDGTVSFHSKSQLLGYIRDEEFTLLSDNAEFAQTMNRRFDSVKEMMYKALEEVKHHQGVKLYPVKVSGEWCGCFHKNTPILLSDGTTEKIGKIVKDKMTVEVMSYNQDTGKLEPKRVTNWFTNGSTDDWLTIYTKRRKRGGKSNKIVVTPNHKIFTERDNELVEVCASELSEGDVVYTQGNSLTREQEQVILGTLLGDGSFADKNHLQVSHSLQQEDYIHYKHKILGGNISTRVSGFGSKMLSLYTTSYPEISDIQKDMVGDTGKQPCKQLLDKLSPMGLAFLYMDDGSLITHAGDGRQPRAELSVQGFTEYSVNLLKNFLNSRGYYCNTSKVNNGLGLVIRFTPEGTHAFLSDIAPFVMNKLRYKLPKYLRNTPFIDISKITYELGESLLKTCVTKVEKGSPYTTPSDKIKYDLEVEDNHNYFANRVLVHNSGIQKGVGISYLPKRSLFVFGVKGGETIQQVKQGWLPVTVCSEIVDDEDNGIYAITDFPVKHITIDFNNAAYSQNTLVEATECVEKSCPVASALGLKDGDGNATELGEGLVWTPKDPDYCWDSGNWFKTKGQKHSVSKVKSVAAVDPEKLNSIKEFVDYAVTENRLEQGLSEVGLDQKLVGTFIGWVSKDVNKEEADTLESNNLSMKDVGKYVANKAREFYISKLNNI